MTFADLIVASAEARDYADLKIKMKETLDDTGMCWYLKIYDIFDKPLEEIYREKCTITGNRGYGRGFQEITLPSYGELESVKIRFRIAEGRVS